jgi:hypothetical protein
MKYFLVKVSYEKECEFQNLKRIVESYVVRSEDADLNALFSDYMKTHVGKVLVNIESINRIKISDVLFFDGDRYFIVKLMIIAENAETKVIRKVIEQYIVRAENLEDALVSFKKKICDTSLTENMIVAVRVLNVIDVLV